MLLEINMFITFKIKRQSITNTNVFTYQQSITINVLISVCNVKTFSLCFDIFVIFKPLVKLTNDSENYCLSELEHFLHSLP